MYKIIEIALIIIIVAGSIVLSAASLRKELSGKCNCESSCESCRIKDSCRDKESKKQKSNIDGK